MKLNPLLSFSLSLLLVLPHAAFAQQSADPADSPWASVKLVPPGDEMEINLKDGKTINGRLVNATDKALVISRGDRTTTIDQANVQKVYRKVPKSGITRTQIGTLTGMAAGAALGGGLGASQDVDVGWTIPIFALMGAGIGAIAGSMSGGRRVKVLIYQAK
jgi:hypothetical protein